MSDFFNQSIDRVARKHHRCSYCGESISAGQTYTFQSGNWDGAWLTSKMHPECFNDMCEQGDGEYTLHSNDRPEKATGAAS